MNQWNVELYQEKHSYVWEYGSEIIQMLDSKAGEYILDLGCGTGELTATIAATGAKVIGLDVAESAIARCRQQYPQLEFIIANGRDFNYPEVFDGVFSNAALHWMQPAADVARCIYQCLKPGGRLVAEFGGKGNVAQIVNAINQVMPQSNYNPWYFPSIGEYSTLLEQIGFEVNYAALFPRPTKLIGDARMQNWIEMFAGDRLRCLSTDEQLRIIKEIESILRPDLYSDGNWWADYKRLQIVAKKPGG
ncbi:type 11 methyltransferase [Chondrocystis sp. NIES-4102]|nr:type 11 methyltransferase [Chondrocystis sp. NIES-4102]